MPLALLLLFFLPASFGEWEVPAPQALQTEADYYALEPDVLKALEWLNSTPLHAQPEKRAKVHRFLLLYSNNNPRFQLELEGGVASISNRNPELIGVYIAAYSAHYIVLKEEAKHKGAVEAALRAVAEAYSKDELAKRDTDLNLLVDSIQRGALSDFMCYKRLACDY